MSQTNIPQIMGILNVTPDSFSDGGLFHSEETAVAHALRMMSDGASIIDIGGESTRPGASPVSANEEIERVIPVIRGVLNSSPQATISVDTTKAVVAHAAVQAGATIINDVSGGLIDPEILDVASEGNARLVLMHMKGTPRTMQIEPRYDDVIEDVRQYLEERVEASLKAGVDLNRIVVDPGIGFGKTVTHNLLLLKHLSRIRIPGTQILLGTSRKSFIGKITGATVEDRLAGSLATIGFALQHNVNIVRVHDVKETAQFLKVWVAIEDA